MISAILGRSLQKIPAPKIRLRPLFFVQISLGRPFEGSRAKTGFREWPGMVNLKACLPPGTPADMEIQNQLTPFPPGQGLPHRSKRASRQVDKKKAVTLAPARLFENASPLRVDVSSFWDFFPWPPAFFERPRKKSCFSTTTNNNQGGSKMKTQIPCPQCGRPTPKYMVHESSETVSGWCSGCRSNFRCGFIEIIARRFSLHRASS